MGCIGSKLDINDVHPNIFTVLRIDEIGSRTSPPGHLQITDSELVLHQKGKEPIRWPLKSLRRYGCESEIFSFESGRRCATGPGVYVFNCARAQNLFNLLQNKIRSGNINQDPDGGNPGSPNSGIRGDGDLSTSLHHPGNLAHRASLPAQSRDGSGRTGRASLSQISLSNGFHRTLSEVNDNERAPTYVNVNCDIDAGSSYLAAAAAAGQGVYTDRVPPLHPDYITPDTPTHQYENVTPGCQTSSPRKYNCTTHSCTTHNCTALNCTTNQLQQISNQEPGHFGGTTTWDPTAGVGTPLTTPQTTPFASPPISPISPIPLMSASLVEKKVCYAQLDLNSQPRSTAAGVVGGAGSNGVNHAVKKPSVDEGIGYSLIDFDKTTALIKTAATRQGYEHRKASVQNSSICDIKTPLSPTD